MTLAARAWTIAATLASALVCAPAPAHAQGPVTEKEAAAYIYGGFLHDAAHAILSRDVKLGPELRRRLALPPDADSRRIYEAMTVLTDQQPLVVRKASLGELSGYGASGLRQPLFVLEAGKTTLLIQYDLQANNIPFMGQLSGPEEPIAARPTPAAPEPPKPVAVPEPPKPVALPPEPPKAVALPPEPPKAVALPPEPPKPAAAPKPVARPPEPPKAPAVAAPPPAQKPRPVTLPATLPPPAPRAEPPAPRVEPIQPNGPCVVKPVMSNQDLVNCGATLR